MTKRILITVGGTGGHIFPAIALGNQLRKNGADLLFVGGNLSANPYFDQEDFSHRSISCATFKKKNPWALMKTMTKILWGIRQSVNILAAYKPNIIVGFGSYYTLPILLAAYFKSVPFILHEANSIPGKVNRLLSKYAAAAGVHFPETGHLLNCKTYEVGLPLRPSYYKGSSTKSQARDYFNLQHSLFTILIFGGSQGAVSLNNLVSKAFAEHLMDLKDFCQIIHLTGDRSSSNVLSDYYKKIGFKSCVKPFESRMDLAWQAADISIARAGAGTIAEQMEFEVPGILIPYPHATDNHQDKNADFLVKTVGGAVKKKESDLTPLLLAQELRSFSLEKQKGMSQAMSDYKYTYRVKNFCNLILEELGKYE